MTRTIRELDTAVLLRDLPDAGLHAGDQGAIVHMYSPDMLEVEFVADSGQTRALMTLSSADVSVTPSEEGSHPEIQRARK